MLTSKEIIQRAKAKARIDSDASIIERGLYQRVSEILCAYDEKIIDKEQAKKEKEQAIEEFERYTALEEDNAELSRRIEQHIEIFRKDDEQRGKLSPLMSEANQHGCELCQKIAKVYDGRE